MSEELREKAKAATPGEWAWTVHDHSMASLGVGSDPGSGTPLVLNVSPCKACRDRAKAWEWGRCTTPSEEDATYIAAANPTAILALLDERDRLLSANEAMRKALEQSHRLFLPIFMQLSEAELMGEPVKDEAILFSFMGGGGSDHVTVGDFRKALDASRSALATALNSKLAPAGEGEANG